MLDVSQFVQRCGGMLRNPVQTMRDHANPMPPWQVVVREHVVPLVVISSAIATVLSWMMPSPHLVALGIHFGPLELLIQFGFRAAIGIAAVLLTGAVVAAFSGVFGGIRGMNGGIVLAGLAMTPHYLAEALWPLPGIGPVLAIAGAIASLVLLYRGAPAVLRLPTENRGKHFALTIIALLLVAIVSGILLQPVILPVMLGIDPASL